MITTADRLQSAEEYYFSKKLAQIQRMEAQGRGPVINLGIGSPDLPPAAQVMEAASAALHLKTTHGYSSYRSSLELRKALAEWYRRDYGVELDPATEVLPLLGSKEGILYVSLAFLNPGDEALIPNPGYPAYSSVTSLIGAKARPYDLRESSKWLPDRDRLEREDLSRCKLMWVNYPNMPTGATASREDFERLLDFGRRKNILICHDNPYSQVLNEKAPLSLLSLDPDLELSLELNSLSKAFNMAGWRIGTLMASSAVIDSVLQVKSNVDSGMFSPLQSGAVRALALPGSWHEERNEVYRERRKAVWRIFDRLGFSYDRGAAGMFVWAKAPDSVPDVTGYIDQLLEHSEVFLTPGAVFGSNGARFARASLCAPVERILEALARVERFLGKGRP